MAKYLHANTDQYHMVTFNFDELFPEDHPTSQLLDIIRKLDLSGFDQNYTNDKVGRKAFPVDRLLAIIFHSLLHGNVSMRACGRALSMQADLMFLSGGLSFDHSTVSHFRKRHAKEIQELFTQTVFLGVESELIDFDTVCIDGTKIKASANGRDIGEKDKLEKRYQYTRELCEKRLREWEACEDEGEKKIIQKKADRLTNRQERLSGGLRFLEEHKERSHVHLTDKDATWQPTSKGFIVGYNAQVAVDAKSQMIVHMGVTNNPADCTQTQSMVNGTEEVKEKCLKNVADAKSKVAEETKYPLDAGYSSVENLAALKDKDLYMPDAEMAHERNIAPEDRKEKKEAEERKEKARVQKELEFRYNEEDNSFTCPANEKLTYSYEAKNRGRQYLVYRRSGCGECEMRARCVGPKGKKKLISIAVHDFERVKSEKRRRIKPYGCKAGKIKASHPLLMDMRKKLEGEVGRLVYGRRLPVVEGAIGVMKAARKGWEFLRREMERVEVEWSERCSAYNLGKVMGFSRV